jgi:hypothetical protein
MVHRLLYHRKRYQSVTEEPERLDALQNRQDPQNRNQVRLVVLSRACFLLCNANSDTRVTLTWPIPRVRIPENPAWLRSYGQLVTQEHLFR